VKRNKKSLYNAITALINTLSSGLFGLIVTKLIIEYYGSDFNGLNAAAAQIITIVMLLEGGFTVATNVALFKPYVNQDMDAVSAIASATNRTFKKIGAYSFVLGIVLTLGYSFIINTGLSQGFVILVFMMTLLPVSTNLYAVTKYRIILQAEQKEYVISMSTFLTSLGRYIAAIIAILLGAKMWMISFTTMVFAMLNNFILYFHVSRKYRLINYKATPNYAAIVGTRDILVQKITGAMYMAVPIIAITLSAGGTMLASVYAVYNSVFMLLKSMLRAVIDAPRLGLGELASEHSTERVWEVFKQYQLAIFAMMFILLTTASVLIMPFIEIYTKNATDINYYQPVIAILMVLISFFELLHIPSGHLMNMTGKFKDSRNIQLISSTILIVTLVIGALSLGIYGILSSVLLTAVVLTVLEIKYIHFIYFKNKIFKFIRLTYPMIFGVPLICLETYLMPKLSGFVQFGLAGIAVIIINAIIGVAVYYLTNKSTLISLTKRMISMIKKKEILT